MSDIDERLGQAVVFKFNDTAIGDVNSVDFNYTIDNVEVINDSSGQHRERLTTRKDWDVSLNVDLTSNTGAAPSGSSQSDIVDAAFSTDATGSIELGPSGSAETGDETLSGDVVVSNFSFSKATDEIITADFEFLGNGDLIRSVET